MENNLSEKIIDLTLTLSPSAISWLKGTTQNNDGYSLQHSKIFFSLLKEIKTETCVDDNFRRKFTLNPSQVQFSELSLCKKWSMGRKKIHNILSKMESLGLVKVFNSRLGSVLTFVCIKGWRDERGNEFKSPYYVPKLVQDSNN